MQPKTIKGKNSGCDTAPGNLVLRSKRIIKEYRWSYKWPNKDYP